MDCMRLITEASMLVTRTAPKAPINTEISTPATTESPEPSSHAIGSDASDAENGSGECLERAAKGSADSEPAEANGTTGDSEPSESGRADWEYLFEVVMLQAERLACMLR
eukprot:7118997-Pyramimonas_sp.AAC.1